MKPKAPLMTCPCCGGLGRVPITKDLLRTWQRLNLAKPAMVSELLEKGVTPNAINNRLVALEKLGLARRHGKKGKWVLWLKVIQ